MRSAARYVLVGVDGSDDSLEALDLAADEAALRDCALRVVTVLRLPAAPSGPDARLRDARGDVDAAARRATRRHPALDVTTDVLTGAPAAVLVERSTDAELLVVGHRGRGGFTALVTGSVPAQVAANARVPVLVARPRERTDPDEPEGPVVVAVDGSAHAAEAVEFACDEASRRGVPLVAVQVWSEPVHPANGRSERAGDEADAAESTAARTLTAALAPARAGYPGLTVVPELIRSAEVEESLVRRSSGATLIVVGARGTGRLSGALLGSAGTALVRHAACPVAIVRPVGG
jgi:nucleotide-binding universal stress UspA family protein